MKHSLPRCLVALLPFLLPSCVSLVQKPELKAVSVPSITFHAHGPTVTLRAPILVKAGQKFSGKRPDGTWTRYVAHKSLGDGSQKEGQKAMFILEPGATLECVRIGKPAADGIHVRAAANRTTTVRQAEFEDVGEDAITVSSGPSNSDVRIVDCAFRLAADKVVQVNAPPRVSIEDCRAENFARFARSSGTSGNQAYRITVDDLVARSGEAVLKMSNSKARGEITGGRYQNVRFLAQASGGAKITVK